MPPSVSLHPDESATISYQIPGGQVPNLEFIRVEVPRPLTAVEFNSLIEDMKGSSFWLGVPEEDGGEATW